MIDDKDVFTKEIDMLRLVRDIARGIESIHLYENVTKFEYMRQIGRFLIRHQNRLDAALIGER